MKRVLVTGGSGFVGANLVRRLVADGHDVHLILRSDHKEWRVHDLLPAVTAHGAALEDAAGVNAVVATVRADWIFHFAAYGAYSSQQDVQRMVKTNILGTVNLVEAVSRNGCEALVYAGSSSEYGYKDHPPAEDECAEPNSNYAVTKTAATMYCMLAAAQLHVPVTSLRLYSVYGPWEEPSRLMPTLAVLGLKGELPPMASPDTARDFIYVDDVVDACIAAADKGSDVAGEIFNVGSGLLTTLRELVDQVRKVLKINAEPTWNAMAARPWDTDVWVSTPLRAEAELGWTARTKLSEGFGLLANWLGADEERLRMYERDRRVLPA